MAQLRQHSTATVMERDPPWQSLSPAATYLVAIRICLGIVSNFETVFMMYWPFLWGIETFVSMSFTQWQVITWQQELPVRWHEMPLKSFWVAPLLRYLTFSECFLNISIYTISSRVVFVSGDCHTTSSSSEFSLLCVTRVENRANKIVPGTLRVIFSTRFFQFIYVKGSTDVMKEGLFVVHLTVVA